MRCRLDFGRTGLDVELPPGARATVIEAPGAVALPDPAAAVREALANPLGCRPLAELARGRRSAVVVISDKTRPVPNADILPPLLATIEAAGIPRERIEILVGTGLHRANTPDELAAMTSPALVSTYRFRNHDARDASAHRVLGRTRQGTEIAIDAGYLDADLKIVTGLVEPHIMAGFSGGAKGVATGIAAVTTIRRTHGPDMLEAHVGPGIVVGNPFYADLVEVADTVGIDFLVNAVIDRARRPVGVFAGALGPAHGAAIDAVERKAVVDLEAEADVVDTSACGFPLDLTFYQSLKGPVAALNVVRRGGTVILAAEMGEGLGSPDFQRLLDRLRDGTDALELLQRPGFFAIDQWMVQHLHQVLRRCHLTVVAPALAPHALDGLPIARASTVEAAVAAALARHGADARVVVIPEGPYVLGTVGGRKLPLHGAAAA